MTQLPKDTTYARSFSALLEVADATNTPSDLTALGQQLLDRALAVTAITSGSIWLHDQGNITRLACYPAPPPTTLPEPDAAIKRVIKTAQPEFDGVSGGILPLLARNELIGVLILGDALEASSYSLFSMVADWVASAIDQVRLAEQLEARQQRLEAITHLQDELLTIISHDLRNPMASIKGYADLLLRRNARLAEDPNRRGLQIISEQVVRMTGLLDQLLDVARINSERLQLDRRPSDLAPIVEHSVGELREKYQEVQVKLEGAEASLPCSLDVGRMKQVIGNVLDNAIKYSLEGGPIEVCVEPVGDEAILSVHNDGIGIPATEAERIFEPFFRANNVTNRPGLGMGLFVAQQLVLRHDGRIWFESTHGAGATFFIALPLLEPSSSDSR